ncbi:hypothetical protein K488DRAFT_82606 [Vararia minispora EC-137]|uniref:Uncharacterized protein n=1 Tax=Vararia minispora EC-137 TaxID=1314806 RepID=A0ACB8QVG4_9AGAM|nr:hypothetical protein K488DRAFT_82606 [Vararia minispora EC-137]
MSLQDVDILQLALQDLDLTVVSILVGSILLGVYILLYASSTFILVRRGLCNPQYAVLFLVTSVMFACSATYWAICVSAFVLTIHDPSPETLAPIWYTRWPVRVMTFCLGLNFWLSDTIVLWRTAVLWRESYLVRRICYALVVLTILFAVVDISVMDHFVPKIPFKPVPSTSTNLFGIIAVFLSLAANVWGTALVSIKTWQLRKLMKEHGNTTRFSTWKILYLLVECGALYCVGWVSALHNALSPPRLSIFVQAFFLATVFVKGQSPIVYIADIATVQMTGIYPTFIIDMVCLQQKTSDAPAAELRRSLVVDDSLPVDLIQLTLSPDERVFKEGTSERIGSLQSGVV